MIDVRDSGIHGRGAFASAAIRQGQTFHTAHLLAFDCSETEAINATAVGAYVFYIEDCPGHTHDRVGLAMSPISFINHSRTASAAFKVDAASQTVTFTALRDIAAGEELTIDYGDFAAKLSL